MTSSQPEVMLRSAVFLLAYAASATMTSEQSDDITYWRPSFDVSISDVKVSFLHNVIDVCDGGVTSRLPPVLAVIVVCSAVDNLWRRDVIRRTWGSPEVLASRRLRLVFLLGRVSSATDQSAISDEAVADESRQYGDVIQADFIDTYANLSRKSLAALYWATSFSACAQFIVKTDDDTFLNTPLLARDLSTCSHHRFIMGHVIARAHPVRQPGAKWFTPISAYQASAYPTYASGAAYVISGDAVASLLRAASSGVTPLFWLEDIYVTGMLAHAAGVQLIVNGKFDGYRNMANECAVRKHIVRHRMTPDDMHRLWNAVIEDTPCKQS